jgi:hypothetical protein|tara:strand:+ start:585 stop:725 length:141 start_codon:yes stop_codon:yes gene_type:complete
VLVVVEQEQEVQAELEQRELLTQVVAVVEDLLVQQMQVMQVVQESL